MSNYLTPAKWRKINLRNVIEKGRGGLVFIEGKNDIPFDIQRIYYIVDVPGGEKRGAHAHKALQQCIVAVNGSFEVEFDDGNVTERFFLNKPTEGILVEPFVWRDLFNFSSGAVCLVLASMPYDESDYIRDKKNFMHEVQSHHT